jgi:uncharacterized membrane protein YfcA
MDLYLTLAFFLVAMLYSSMGFGGGSTYLALLSISPLETSFIRPLGLLLNALVTGINISSFLHKGYTAILKFWPYLLVSIPFSFWGGTFGLDQEVYLKILGFSLLVASGAMLLPLKLYLPSPVLPYPFLFLTFLSAFLGFLGGLVGIGGGIFLAPILHIIRWDSARNIAGIASLFIFLNSLAGLWGLSYALDGMSIVKQNWTLFAAVIGGGITGNLVSWKWLTPTHLKRGTALLLFGVSLRLLFA